MRGIAMRIEWAAAICTVALFAVCAVFLYIDHKNTINPRQGEGRMVAGQVSTARAIAGAPAPAAARQAAVNATAAATVATVSDGRVAQPASPRGAAPSRATEPASAPAIAAPVRAEPPQVTAAQKAALNE